jgi:hypothetical protein
MGAFPRYEPMTLNVSGLIWRCQMTLNGPQGTGLAAALNPSPQEYLEVALIKNEHIRGFVLKVLTLSEESQGTRLPLKKQKHKIHVVPLHAKAAVNVAIILCNERLIFGDQRDIVVAACILGDFENQIMEMEVSPKSGEPVLRCLENTKLLGMRVFPHGYQLHEQVVLLSRLLSIERYFALVGVVDGSV